MTAAYSIATSIGVITIHIDGTRITSSVTTPIRRTGGVARGRGNSGAKCGAVGNGVRDGFTVRANVGNGSSRYSRVRPLYRVQVR